MIALWTNNATSTLAGDISSGATALTVQTGAGALYPNPMGGDYFYCTLSDGVHLEIIKVTARSTDTFTTIVRAQQGTTAHAFLAATPTEVDLRLTAADLVTLQNATGLTSVTAPLVNTSGDVSIPAATSSTDGYLVDTDWSTFNNKAPTASPTFTGVATAPQIKSAPVTPSIVAGAVTVSWADSQFQILNLVADTTITWSNTVAGEAINLEVNASGAYTLAFPAGTLFVGGMQPVQTASGTDTWTVVYDGTHYYAYLGGQAWAT